MHTKILVYNEIGNEKYTCTFALRLGTFAVPSHKRKNNSNFRLRIVCCVNLLATTFSGVHDFGNLDRNVLSHLSLLHCDLDYQVLQNAVVKVVIPTERYLLIFII